MDLSVKHDAEQKKFYVTNGEQEARILYELKENGTVMDLTDTFVPEDLRKMGLAGKMAEFAMEYIKKNGIKVIATCPFIVSYLENHEEYSPLIYKK